MEDQEMLQSVQNENNKKTMYAKLSSNNEKKDNKKDKDSKQKDKEETDGKDKDSSEIKAKEPKTPDEIEKQFGKLKELAFLDLKDLKDPLPEESKFKQSDDLECQPIDFWDFTEQMWAKVFYNLQLDKAFSVIKGEPNTPKQICIPPKSFYLRDQCFLTPSVQSQLDYSVDFTSRSNNEAFANSIEVLLNVSCPFIGGAFRYYQEQKGLTQTASSTYREMLKILWPVGSFQFNFEDKNGIQICPKFENFVRKQFQGITNKSPFSDLIRAMDKIRKNYGDGYPKVVEFGVGAFGSLHQDTSKLFKQDQNIDEKQAAIKTKIETFGGSAQGNKSDKELKESISEFSNKNVKWFIKGIHQSLNVNSDDFDPCEAVKVRNNANSWQILQIKEWYQIYELFPDDVQKIIFSFKNKVPDFIWKYSQNFEYPVSICQSYKEGKDYKNFVFTDQLSYQYKNKKEWKTDLGIQRSGSTTNERYDNDYWLSMFCIKVEKNFKNVLEKGSSQIKFKFIPQGNKIRIRKTTYVQDNLLNKEADVDEHKDVVSKDEQQKAKKVFSNLTKIKNWCFSRKREDKEKYQLILEEEDLESDKQLYELKMDYTTGKFQLFFRENGEKYYLTTEDKKKMGERRWKSYLDGPVCVDSSGAYCKYREITLEHVNGSGLKLFFQRYQKGQEESLFYIVNPGDLLRQ